MVLPAFLRTIFRRKKRTQGTELLFLNYAVFEYDFSTIRVATGEFSVSIGQNEAYTLYKGKLPNGQEIAVKEMSSRRLETVNEVQVLTKLRHKNLINLLGSCFGPGRYSYFLVYEFVSNLSLDHFIYDPLRGSQLTWEICRNIIGGIARGLRYLHEECGLRIIHGDINPVNILFDAEMEPKIASFRWARLMQEGQAVSESTLVRGTRGYVDPEYYRTSRFSFKSDVYSFGVVILAIISRRKSFTVGQENLVDYVRERWNPGETIDVIHEVMREEERRDSISEILRYIHIALLCVDDNPETRPSIDKVLHWFSCFSTPLPERTTGGPSFAEAETNRSLCRLCLQGIILLFPCLQVMEIKHDQIRLNLLE